VKNIFGCRQLFIRQTCQNHIQNTLYFGLHKNQKCVDHICFQIYKYYHNLSFLCSPQYNKFCIKIFMLVGYIMDYVQINFHIFLKKIKIQFLFFLKKESLKARSQKHLPCHVRHVFIKLCIFIANYYI
jgi:hypothetical protein